MEKQLLAVLIDADNISSAMAGEVFEKASSIGEPIVRRAYGMVNCFASPDGWQKAQREYGIVSMPQVSNVSGKNAADIALVVDAMELLFKNSCDGICIVSNDSDFTAVAAKIRENGKRVYGIGGPKTPDSFRKACTKFMQIAVKRKQTPSAPAVKKSDHCPRCGSLLEVTATKSRNNCRRCPQCGGMVAKLSVLKNVFSEDGLAMVEQYAMVREQQGCICPDCGTPMSLIKVSVGKRSEEIDVCPKCRSVWYDKDEFESLVPGDGALVTTVSAGKAFRRGLVVALTADLKAKRLKAPDIGALNCILKKVFHAPKPDIPAIINALTCQKVISVDKSGKVTVLD